MLKAAREIGVRLCWLGWGRVAEQQLGHRSLFWALHSSPGSAAWWSLWDWLSQHELHRLTSSLSRTLLLCLDKSWRPLRLKQDVRAHAARGLLTASISPAPSSQAVPYPSQHCTEQRLSDSRSWRGGCCCAHERVADKAKRDVESSPAPLQVVATQSTWLVSPSLGAALPSAALLILAGVAFKAGRFLQEFPTRSENPPRAAAGAQGSWSQPCLVLVVGRASLPLLAQQQGPVCWMCRDWCSALTD